MSICARCPSETRCRCFDKERLHYDAVAREPAYPDSCVETHSSRLFRVHLLVLQQRLHSVIRQAGRGIRSLRCYVPIRNKLEIQDLFAVPRSGSHQVSSQMRFSLAMIAALSLPCQYQVLCAHRSHNRNPSLAQLLQFGVNFQSQ
jgi:hypothetical protein